MHPTEIHFLEVSKRLAMVGVQVAQAYNQEQAKLNLDAVLSPDRLSSEEGTTESIETLETLRELTQAHKDAYDQFMLTAMSELRAVLEAMPPDIQLEHKSHLASSVNWQLAAQAEFYANRATWIGAAEAICNLIQSRRATCVFTDAGVDFVDDVDLIQFSRLLEKIEETHQVEVSAFQERVSRLNKALSVIGERAQS
jgi:hypothetical protein